MYTNLFPLEKRATALFLFIYYIFVFLLKQVVQHLPQGMLKVLNPSFLYLEIAWKVWISVELKIAQYQGFSD